MPVVGNSCWAYARKSLRPSMKRKLVAGTFLVNLINCIFRLERGIFGETVRQIRHTIRFVQMRKVSHENERNIRC